MIIPAANLICLALYVTTFGLFSWGLKYYFRQTQSPTPPGLTWIKLIGLAGVLAQAYGIWNSRGGPFLSYSSAVVLVLAIWIFVAAKRAHGKRAPALVFEAAAPEEFVSVGPYRWIRHPFYLSYLLGWTGGALGAAELWATLPVFVMTVSYGIAANQEEFRILCGSEQKSYELYRARTGMFFPRLSSAKTRRAVERVTFSA